MTERQGENQGQNPSTSSVLSAFAGHMAIGAFLGAAIGYPVLTRLTDPGQVIELAAQLGLQLERMHAPWAVAGVGAVAGAILGALISPLLTARKRARDAGFLAALGTRGYQAQAGAQQAVNQRLVAEVDSEYRLHNVAVKQLPGSRLAVGELEITRTRREIGSDRDTTTITTQTAAFFQPERLRLPRFKLQPQSFAVKAIARMLAAEFPQGITFPSKPEFSRLYHLSAPDEGPVRALFGERLLAVLAARPALNVESGSGSLLVYRGGKDYNPEAIDPFLNEATEVFRAFEEAARRTSAGA